MPVEILQLTNDRLQPALYPGDARTSNGKYGASKFFPKGCVIGRKTSDGLLYPVGTANVVQTFSQTGTATAGTVTLTVPKPDGSFGTTTALAYNISLANLQTALDVATGVTNGIVATSVGSAAPFSNPAVLTLTYSGTGYAAVNQPLATADISNLTGTTALTASAVQPNRTQVITPTTAASAGHFAIGIKRPTGVIGWTGPLAYDITTANLQTALDLASGVANGVVATVASGSTPFVTPSAITLTYSGTGYANLPQELAQIVIGGDVVGTTKITVDDTTFTEDGTEKAVGFNEFAFQTDANSKCYINTGTAAADTVATPSMTMPFFNGGYFRKSDLVGWNDAMLVHLGARMHTTDIIHVPG
jgi:hypothetical protein